MKNLDHIDLTNLQSYTDHGYPYEDFATLRKEAPVYWYQRPGFEPFWAITKYDDIGFISRNPQLFSSRQRMSVNTLDAVEMLEGDRERRAAAFNTDPDEPLNIFWMDPPKHRDFRSFVSSYFSHQRIHKKKELFTKLAEKQVAQFINKVNDGGKVDVAGELSSMLPVDAICSMLGLPEKDWMQMFRWSEGMVSCHNPEHQLEGESMQQTFMRNAQAFEEYLVDYIKHRYSLKNQPDDVIGALCQAKLDGEDLPFHQVLWFAHVLLVAGNGTTRNTITSGVKVLLEQEKERLRFQDHPELLNSAVEEILRYTSTVIQMARTCKEDTVIRGVPIKAGQTLVMFYPSANRDEDIFTNPNLFDIGRTPNQHFTFGGYGEHFCLGSVLARLQLQCIFGALRPHLHKFQFAGDYLLSATHLALGEVKLYTVEKTNEG